MSKPKEIIAGIIPMNDRDEATELEVVKHMADIMATNPFKVTKKYTHIEIPEFKDSERRERLDWELEEIRRCKEGWNGLSGRYYFFLMHCKIKHKSRGTIRPDFRAWQMNFGAVKDRIQKTPGLGLVSIKRRQVGASWDYAADNIYDCSFNRDYDIGMNSKTELDSQEFFKKHKFIHRNLPKFLKALVSTDKRDEMRFSKYDRKTGLYTGTGSSIISTSPVPTSHAGRQYRKLVIDEAGLQEDLMALWSQSEDCIRQDTVRVGTPYIFGSVGDTSKQGKGLMEFWTKNDLYNMERFGIYGYNGLLCDDWGNDMIEDAVRFILYTRKRIKEGSSVVYNTYIQNFPLNDEEALLQPKGSGVGNPILRARQIKYLLENPPVAHKGRMSPGVDGKPSFIADDNNGKIIIYERPELVTNGYVAALDPAEDDDTTKDRDTSNLSTAILAKPFGLSAPRLVAEYVDRPAKLADYYEQLALLLKWYNNTPVLIEMNRGGWRAKDYFEPRWPKLLALAPKSFNSIKGGFELKVGVKMTAERKSQMIGLGDAYVEDYWNTIPSMRLLKEMAVFGNDHADDDLCTSFLWALIALQSDRRLVTGIETEAAKNPNLRYETVHGVKQLVSRGNIVSPPTIKTKNPLFNKPR